VSSEPSAFELHARPLAAEDAAWLTFFDAGAEWWCEEVTGFLRQYALEHAKAGYGDTVLFSFPDEKHVVGFLAVASSSLQLTQVQGAYPKFGPPPGVETSRVPVWLVPYFGVDRNVHGRAYGDEMHIWLLNAMEGLLGAPRFLYLQCWKENERGIRFWQRLGYKQFHETSEKRADATVHLAWLLFDRFLIPPAPKEEGQGALPA
jgi:ribosomal protein S18 acetylase RimI-like enzyme